MQFTKAGLQNLFSPVDEDDIVEKETLHGLKQKATGCLDIKDDESVDLEHGMVVDEEDYSANKQPAGFEIARVTFERREALYNDF